METTTLGRYIVADPDICYGEPTFRGTRILIADVLKPVESGTAWDAIIEVWRYALTIDVIAEAVCMTHAAMVTYAPGLVRGIKNPMNVKP